MLAEYLSKFEQVMYVSAEQGISKSFQEAYIRSGLDPSNRKLKIVPYTELTEIEKALAKQRAPKVVIIDNTTVYKDELTALNLGMGKNYRNVLFIFLAHEEKGEPT